MERTRLRLRVAPGSRRPGLAGRPGARWEGTGRAAPGGRARKRGRGGAARGDADTPARRGEDRFRPRGAGQDRGGRGPGLGRGRPPAGRTELHRVSAIDTNRFRDLLLDHRKQVTDAIEYLHKENPGSITDETDEVTTDNHLADVATVTYDRELDYTLEENSEELLRAIDDALVRINDGKYGICENRGEEISAERLEAVPWTRLCIDCKRLEER